MRLPIALAFLGIASGVLAQNPDSQFQEITLKRHLGQQARDDTRALALRDLDGDGSLDLFAGNLHNPNRYFRNDGLARFTDIPVTHGPGVESTLAVAMGDVDQDGDLDLILVIADQARLLLNDGAAGLTDVTASHVPQDRAETRAVVFGDVDGDGDP